MRRVIVLTLAILGLILFATPGSATCWRCGPEEWVYNPQTGEYYMETACDEVNCCISYREDCSEDPCTSSGSRCMWAGSSLSMQKGLVTTSPISEITAAVSS